MRGYTPIIHTVELEELDDRIKKLLEIEKMEILIYPQDSTEEQIGVQRISVLDKYHKKVAQQKEVLALGLHNIWANLLEKDLEDPIFILAKKENISNWYDDNYETEIAKALYKKYEDKDAHCSKEQADKFYEDYYKKKPKIIVNTSIK